jgi:hypothetical protein
MNQVTASDLGIPESYPSHAITRSRLLELRVELAKLREPRFNPSKFVGFTKQQLEYWSDPDAFGNYNPDQQVLILSLLKSTMSAMQLAEYDNWADKEIELCFS